MSVNVGPYLCLHFFVLYKFNHLLLLSLYFPLSLSLSLLNLTQSIFIRVVYFGIISKLFQFADWKWLTTMMKWAHELGYPVWIHSNTVRWIKCKKEIAIWNKIHWMSCAAQNKGGSQIKKNNLNEKKTSFSAYLRFKKKYCVHMLE